MRRMVFGGVAALAILVIGTVLGKAMMIAPQPVAQRVALAQCVVVGKVTALEEKPVAASTFPGVQQKSFYKVAVIKIVDGLMGAKGLTSIRVGFLPPPPPPPAVKGGENGPKIRPFILRKRYPTVDLKVGQEACFILDKHHEASFYVASNFNNVIYKNNAFDNQVKQIKHYTQLLATPMKGLKAKDAEDRLTTAGMLINRYRTAKPGMKFPYKTEAIDADESKLILTTLAEADFTKPRTFDKISPLMVFGQLQLTEKDGWKPPQFKTPQEYPNAAKAWLKDNMETYRIQRIVVAKADDKK
jgi:hypothetical protein